jgi:beta-mannosidase
MAANLPAHQKERTGGTTVALAAMPAGSQLPDLGLAGTWRAAVADDELRRVWADPGFDDATWAPVQVPGHWRSAETFADTDGPLLYRRRFEAAAGAPGERAWLVLDGLFYQGDVWLDGGYLGDTEGYFAPHEFEVTDRLAEGTEHALGIEVTCAPPTDLTAKRALTGVYQHGPFLAPSANPGGIWQPVRVRRTGPVAIRRLRVLCTEATAERAMVSLDVVLDSPEATSVTARTTIGDVEHFVVQPLAAGENRVRWTVPVEQPDLWWPRALGEQPLRDVHLQILLDDTGADAGGEPPSDESHRTIGLRSVALRNWVLSVNGERLFLKGANVGPVGAAPGEATVERVERDIHAAVDAGLDLLRVNGHIGHPALYDAADRAGLLLWQDLPLQWGYHRSVRRQAVRQARQAVDLLGGHPSIAIWCGHNEPAGPQDAAATDERSRPSFSRYLLDQEKPGWNRSVLDRSIRRALSGADPTRPVVAHSGVLPHPPTLDGTDLHSPFGWRHGGVDDLPAFARLLPRAVRFVGEFGAQAVPDSAAFCDPARWPRLDWERLERDHGLEREALDAVAPPQHATSFDAWRDATQRHQAEVVRRHVETLRVLKYHPTGGFAAFFLSDARPAVSAALIDHDGRPKAAHQALVAACRPVIVVADLPSEALPAGSHLHVDVHAVSDLHVELPDAVVTATVRTGSSEHTTRWQGDLPVDGCVLVGRLHVDLPDGPGEVVVDLALDAAGHHVTNRYVAAVDTV